MQNNFTKRPQTAKYRNESHIFFNDENINNSENKKANHLLPKKRPQSYRNISKVSQFMNDYYLPDKQTQQIHYSNVIQNRDQHYYIQRGKFIPSASQSHDFSNFLEKTGGKLFKPVDQFTEYTDLMRRNSSLLRRAQFSMPIKNNNFQTNKKNQNFSRASYSTSKYFTRTRGATTNTKLGNTIEASLNQSIKEKKSLKKQKQMFAYKTQKYIKPFNKTFLGFANEYEQMMGRQRENNENKSLKNAMNRVLTMQVMGKDIKQLTKLYT